MINFDVPPLKNVIKILLRGLKIDNLSEVKPRALKTADEKFLRTKKNAEVFSPSRLVKQMIDALDENLFWQSKIDSKWLEIACGEAPFITNRYDAESGEKIPFAARAGILDRKFRAIPAVDKIFWAKRAVQSVYGYEIQSDSLLIARANILLSFSEFAEDFTAEDLSEVAEIISKNFFPADGLKTFSAQSNLFDDPNFDCKITDWLTGEEYFFGGNGMKFDFVVGNPPYQEETDNESTRKLPVYHKLMEQAQKVGKKVELITPARFLFDAGDTPKDFNKKMLNDEHFKVLDYAPDARKVFKNIDIEGGVAITLHDEEKIFGATGTFIKFEELRTIHQKVVVDNENFQPFNQIIYPRAIYRFVKDNSFVDTNAFEKMREFFFDEKPNDGKEYLKVLGRLGNKRIYKWICRDNVTSHETLNKYKVFVAQSFGRGNLGNESGQIISPPLIGEPLTINTATFTAIGAFETRAEAESCLKYVKSKFCRAMWGILKVTQHNPPATWAKVPLQDFTLASDIDWTVSISEIDQQLYKKYGLDDAEIKFIEEKVRAME